MKNVILLISGIFFATSGLKAEVTNTVHTNYNNSVIFVENGITFSIFRDGEFDFYMENVVGPTYNRSSIEVGYTFNSGYNYNPYVQYDAYGAVIQVQNVPIYYDYYGRVNQIGAIPIRYNNGFVIRVGGLGVVYNSRGYYGNFTGYVNYANRFYTYRPYFNYFVRPVVGACIVYNRPYRRYYTPVRYTYYKPYHRNFRKSYARVGSTYRNSRHYNRRSAIYKNDRRVVQRSAHHPRRSSYSPKKVADNYRSNARRTAQYMRERSDANRSNRQSHIKRDKMSRETAQMNRRTYRSTPSTSSERIARSDKGRTVKSSGKNKMESYRNKERASYKSKERNRSKGIAERTSSDKHRRPTIEERPANSRGRSSRQ